MDLTLYFKFVAALALVLGLILLLSWVLRRTGLAGPIRPRGRRRLEILETLPVDTRNRLVLVRRDGTEHLLLVGAAGATLVETGIAPPAAPAGFALPPSPEPPLREPQ